MPEHTKQRMQSVKTSEWALSQFEKIRSYLTDEDRAYIRDLLLNDTGTGQVLRKPRGSGAKEE